MAENLTVFLQGCLDRLQRGDDSAREELIRHARDRLTRLTHKMLQGYPGVHRWEQTDDVLQNASLRLMRAIQAVKPVTTRDFFRLAATQIRRELLDMARHYYGPQGAGALHRTRVPEREQSGDREREWEPGEVTQDPSRLADWSEFHAQVEKLGEEEREVFDLLWYQGLSQAEAAELMRVSERTIKRYWQSARLKIYEMLGEDFFSSRRDNA